MVDFLLESRSLVHTSDKGSHDVPLSLVPFLADCVECAWPILFLRFLVCFASGYSSVGGIVNSNSRDTLTDKSLNIRRLVLASESSTSYLMAGSV